RTRACEEAGVLSRELDLPGSISEAALIAEVEKLNAERAVHGILVQLPLPKHVNAARVLESVAPAKDIDGFHAQNLGALLAGAPKFVPCPPAGVTRLLE